MNYFLFLFEASVCLALWSLIYVLFLEKTRSHGLKRKYLLAGLVFSISIPLLHIPVFPEIISVRSGAGMAPILNSFEGTETAGYSWTSILPLLYLIPLVALAITLVTRLLKIRNLILSSQRETFDDHVKVFVDKPHFLASFGKYLFLNSDAEQYSAHQIDHELNHIKQRHSIDVVLMEFYKIIFWCNPVSWLYQRSIRENHEYLADADAAGESSETYAEALLTHAISTQTHFPMHTFHSFIQKRVEMLISNQPKFAAMRYLLVAPLLFGLIYLFSFSTYPVFVDQDGNALLSQDTIPINDARSRLIKDSIFVIDTMIVFDSETFEETFTINRKKISFEEYYKDVKGLDLMNTIDTVVIFDPVDFSENVYIYDYGKNTIDTLVNQKGKLKKKN